MNREILALINAASLQDRLYPALAAGKAAGLVVVDDHVRQTVDAER